MLIGPGGAGKGTLASELVARDDSLWLSRSWTTREARPGERERGAYVFVDRATFEDAIARGAFFEWAEFLDYLMGTPIPDPPPGTDVLLEIDVQGAEQVLSRRPDATVILLLPPSAEVQAERLAARGDDEEHIRRRVELGRSEVERGARIAAHTVVNDDLQRALDELTAIVDWTRSAASCAENPEES
ncbi:MAG: guanylate kinase [Acidimicrobiales bacterium]|nr:guanylate kinase [Acidimicrobiales bacterium]